jgi:hypothetical protein
MVKKTKKSLKKKIIKTKTVRRKNKLLGVKHHYGGAKLTREEVKKIHNIITDKKLLELNKRYENPTNKKIFDPIKSFYDDFIYKMNKEKWVEYFETTISEDKSENKKDTLECFGEVYDIYLYFISERRKIVENPDVSFKEKLFSGSRKEKLSEACSSIQPFIDAIYEYLNKPELTPIKEMLETIIFKLSILKDNTCNLDERYYKPIDNSMRRDIKHQAY